MQTRLQGFDKWKYRCLLKRTLSTDELCQELQTASGCATILWAQEYRKRLGGCCSTGQLFPEWKICHKQKSCALRCRPVLPVSSKQHRLGESLSCTGQCTWMEFSTWKLNTQKLGSKPFPKNICKFKWIGPLWINMLVTVGCKYAWALNNWTQNF